MQRLSQLLETLDLIGRTRGDNREPRDRVLKRSEELRGKILRHNDDERMKSRTVENCSLQLTLKRINFYVYS